MRVISEVQNMHFTYLPKGKKVVIEARSKQTSEKEEKIGVIEKLMQQEIMKSHISKIPMSK